MKTKTPDKLLTPEEAAEILRVTRRTVYTLLRSGKIKSQRVGNLWRIPESSLQSKA